MKYTIEKGSAKLYLFMGVGILLALMSSYELYYYLQTNSFVAEFPGDWDMPLGIAAGLFLIIRAFFFITDSKTLFIEITDTHLIYRTNRTQSIQKVELVTIKKIQNKDGKINIVTKDSSQQTIINFNTVRVRPELKQSIKDSLTELT